MVPRKKLVKSILISLGAVVSAWALDWAEVLQAGPLITGVLAVVVNYLQELADERRKNRQLREKV